MKKLALIAVVFSLFACKCDRKKKSALTIAPTKQVTLNGVLLADAEKMVTAFEKDSIGIDSQTSIWFDEDFIDNVYSLLKYEGGDGVRIYFAKDSANHNTVVMVSTKDGGLSTNVNASGHIHSDYFEHSSPILDADVMKIKVVDYLPIKNWDLPCPKDTCNTNIKHHISCGDAHKWIGNFKPGVINTNSVWYDTTLIKKIHFELIAC